jgi:hypothetical protein
MDVGLWSLCFTSGRLDREAGGVSCEEQTREMGGTVRSRGNWRAKLFSLENDTSDNFFNPFLHKALQIFCAVFVLLFFVK